MNQTEHTNALCGQNAVPLH